MLVIKKEEKDNIIYTTYVGDYDDFPEHDDNLGTRLILRSDEFRNKYQATYSQFKKENYISKIRAIAEQNKGKEFPLKYPDLANRIEDAASRGLFQLELASLSEDELEALEGEGFEILKDLNSHCCIVKW